MLLLALATIGSAWSAYQVSHWNRVDTDEARTSALARIESSRQYALATQYVSYDAAVMGQYAQAYADDDAELKEFLRQTLVRPGFVPLFEQWKAEVAAGRFPDNLLENREYLDELFADSRASDLAATEATERSEAAGAHADDYVSLTLFFATALFFAGVTASFRGRVTKLILLAAATATLLYAGVQLAGYPVA